MKLFKRTKKNERWSEIERRKRRNESIIDVICGVLILPMFYVLTVLVFCL